MKKIVFVIFILLITVSLFANIRRVKAIGDFYSRMPAEDAFALVEGKELIEKYSGVDYTFYDFGDIVLYISEGVLTGVKIYNYDYKIFGYGIGDLFDTNEQQRMWSRGFELVYFGTEYAIKYTGVRFFVGSSIYARDMPIDRIYAIQVNF